MRFDIADSAAPTWRKSSYCGNGANCVEVGVWRKSSYSGNGANCVEVTADAELRYLVRDTKDRVGPVLAFTADEWAAFTAGVKAGEFDSAH